jgi:hypothetical protein
MDLLLLKKVNIKDDRDHLLEVKVDRRDAEVHRRTHIIDTIE